MKKTLILVVCISAVLLSQESQKIIGSVTYLSSQNFYVHFETTKNISVGDTIYISETGTSAGVIQYLSTQSAACVNLQKNSIELNSQVYVIKSNKSDESTAASLNNNETENFFTKGISSSGSRSLKSSDEFNFSGRFSVRSFSNYTNGVTKAQNQYLRYSLSLRAKNIGIKDVSFQSSAVYGYRTDNFNNSGSIWNNLKVYDFFFLYQPATSTELQVGRIRNQNLYALSTFDGVLLDYTFSHFTVGTFAGSHPDWQNMGVNIKLMQYGAFLSREDSLEHATITNNLSFANQTNAGKTDRRFLYFLHRTRMTNFSFSLSSEFDLYQVELHKQKSVFNPTSVYASALYRYNNSLSFDLSYDARKAIYYFESFKSTLDSILDSRMRQGVKFGTTYQWSKTLSVGLNGGFTKQTDDSRPSLHAGTSVSLTEVTKLKFTFIADFTYLQSNFLNGFAYGIKFSKNFFVDNLNAGLGLRRVDYLFARNTSDGIAQNILDADLRWQLTRTLYLNFVYEFVSEKSVTANRLFMGLSQSF